MCMCRWIAIPHIYTHIHIYVVFLSWCKNFGGLARSAFKSYFTFSCAFLRGVIILSYHHHGYPDPSLATPPYRSSLPVGSQGYIPYPHRAAVCRFELVALLLLDHVKGSHAAINQETKFRKWFHISFLVYSFISSVLLKSTYSFHHKMHRFR